MRFMVIVEATQDRENVIPPTEELAAVAAYNEELLEAGVLLAVEGLQPSTKGVRVYFNGDERSVIDGPFTEAKELIGGFWLWQCASLEEAIQWAQRYPNPTGVQLQLEIRQVFETDEYEMTPELRAAEAALRSRLEG